MSVTLYSIDYMNYQYRQQLHSNFICMIFQQYMNVCDTLSQTQKLAADTCKYTDKATSVRHCQCIMSLPTASVDTALN